MKFRVLRKLSSKTFWVNNSIEFSRAYSRIKSLGKSKNSAAYLAYLGININGIIILSSEQKREKGEKIVDNNNEKRLKSGESRFNMVNVEITVNVKKCEPDITDFRNI
jgi:hypothetical protein